MDKSIEALVGMAVLGAAALAAFAFSRWRQRRRVRRVEGWVRDYLVGRYGRLPGGLDVNCSDDPLWPVLVAFAEPPTGARRRLRCACPGTNAPLSLLPDHGASPDPAAAPEA